MELLGPRALQRLLPRWGTRAGDTGLQHRWIFLSGVALGSTTAHGKARTPGAVPFPWKRASVHGQTATSRLSNLGV